MCTEMSKMCWVSSCVVLAIVLAHALRLDCIKTSAWYCVGGNHCCNDSMSFTQDTLGNRLLQWRKLIVL